MEKAGGQVRRLHFQEDRRFDIGEQDVEAEEESLRAQVLALLDAQRQAFYAVGKREIKDPDTYAVLNWCFLAGLHHFYLGRWGHGLIDIGIFLLGIILIIAGHALIGIGCILAISAWELWALVRAQIIVQDWNNKVYKRVLQQYGGGLEE